MLEAPLPPHATLPIALVPLTKSSPERRVTQKEIIAGEERPKFLTIKQVQDSGSQDGDGKGGGDGATAVSQTPQRYIVETITMTTVTERRIVQKDGSSTPPESGSATIGTKGSPVVCSTAASIMPSSSTTLSPIVPAGNEGGSTAVPTVAGGATTAQSSLAANHDYRLLQQQQQQQKGMRTGQTLTGGEGSASQQQQTATGTGAGFQGWQEG
uniref:Uncharacterized protein n=1 Tax=Anopheles culicifacies TaxID=139723 RepID=A0A182LSM8_9DIPT